MIYEKIPTNFQVGGANMEVHNVERSDDNAVGQCFLAGGYIEIAEKCNKDDIQSDGSKVNTFYHELTHAILDTMGEFDLSKNEKFVNTFAGFLTEAMHDAYFKIEE